MRSSTEHLAVIRSNIRALLRAVTEDELLAAAWVLDVAPQDHAGIREFLPSSAHLETIDIDPEAGAPHIGDSSDHRDGTAPVLRALQERLHALDGRLVAASASAGFDTGMNLARVAALAATGYVAFRIYQDSGGARNASAIRARVTRLGRRDPLTAVLSRVTGA